MLDLLTESVLFLALRTALSLWGLRGWAGLQMHICGRFYAWGFFPGKLGDYDWWA